MGPAAHAVFVMSTVLCSAERRGLVIGAVAIGGLVLGTNVALGAVFAEPGSPLRRRTLGESVASSL
jgi:hypothetical protein